MALCVMIFLLVIPASLAQEDMKGKVFLFPKETKTDYVSLTPNITRPLEKVSVCLRSYTDLPGTCSLFSLATPDTEEAFYIADHSLSSSIYINGNSTRFITASESLVWRHVCVTWDSHTGVVLLWVNGKLYLRTVSTKGSPIAAETSIVLGQRQNTFEGQSFSLWPFVGEISDVHMWDDVLTPDGMLEALHGNAQGEMALCVMMFLLVIPTSLAQEDMKGKVFLFHKDKHTDHVSLTPNITKPLEKFSVCLYVFRDFLRNLILFSLASPGTGNKFYFLDSSSTNTVHMDQDSALFRTNMEPYEWKHACVTWNSDTGVVQLWVNGKLYPRKVCMKGSSIPAETSMVLGQKQDSFQQRPASYPFVGEISDLHMWDYVLTPDEMLQALNKKAHGNVINWNSLLYEIKGDILVLPKSRCPYQVTSKSCK